MTIKQAVSILDRSERGRDVARELYQFLSGRVSGLDVDGQMAVLSLIEDVVSAGLSLVAILLPVLALLLVVALFVVAWRMIRRLRLRRAERPATGAAPP